MITKDKSFYRNFFSLLGFLALQNMIVLAVNLIDNIMIGSYSEEALSGVASVNQLQFIFQQTLGGVGEALVVLGSQYWGQGRTEPVKRILNGALTLGLFAGVLLFVLSALIPDKLVMIFTSNPAYIEKGVEYLRLMKYTYLLFPISSVLFSCLRSVETVRIAFISSIVSLVVNGTINYMLISGNCGFPELGVTGAATGTLIARIVELTMLLVYTLKIDKKLKIKIKDFFIFDKTLMKDYLKNSRSFVIVSTLFGFSTALQTVILGHMEDVSTAISGSPIAANSISSTLYMMLKVASVGAASAASIIIGKEVGKNNLPKVKEYAKTLQLIFIGIGILTSIVLFTIRTPILGLYEISDATRELANSFILVLCVTCIGTSYQMPTVCGIVRGGGDSAFVLKNDVISIWGIVLPLSFLAAFVFNWPPVVVVFCLNSDQLFKCIAVGIKANKFNWVKHLTRAESEITDAAEAQK